MRYIAAASRNAVDERGGEVAVVQGDTPVGVRPVDSEHGRAARQVALVDDMEEPVGSRVAGAEAAEFVTGQHVRMDV